MQYSYAQCTFTDAPLGEICSTAEYICGSKLHGYTGRLRTKNITEVFWNNSANNPKAGVCNNAGQFDNTSWFSFTACSKNVHLRIHFYNSFQPQNNLSQTGIQTGLFSECRKSSSVACADSVGATTGIVDLKYNNFVPGQLVYFVLDGYAATVCDFRIEVVTGLDTTPVTPPDAAKLNSGYITGPAQLSCSQKFTPVTFSLLEPERAINFSNSCAPPPNFNPIDSVCYSWSVTPATGWNFYKNISVGKSSKIEFTAPGTYTIYAHTNFNPFYVGSCANVASGKINSWTVTVLPENILKPDPEFVCPGDVRYFCGQTVTSDTLMICDEDPCNIVYQQFIFKSNTYDDLGVIHLCKGGSFEFQGSKYNSPGTFQVVDEKECSLIHTFSIALIDIDVKIEAPVLTLDCNHYSINLSAQVQSLSGGNTKYQWYNEKNELQGSDKSLIINIPGVYTLNVEINNLGGSCQASSKVRILSDFDKPKIVANLPVVRCKFPNERPAISISSLNGYASSTWETPTGAVVNSLSITVDSVNAILNKPYKLHLIGNNGCVLDTNFILKTNFEKAVLSLLGEDLTCKKPMVTIQARPNALIDSIRWNKISPDQKFYGSHISKLTQDVNEAGTYRVDIMASSSKCWTSESIAIADNMIYPDFSFDKVIKWHCNTKSIDITPDVFARQTVTYHWNTNNGVILSNRDVLNISVGGPGIYRLTGLDIDNGCSKSEDLIIEEEPNKPSAIEIETDDIRCFNEQNGTLLIRGTQGGFNPYTYYLNDKLITEQNITNLSKGIYNLEVHDIYDCIVSKQFAISEPISFEVQTDKEITVDFNETQNISFSSNYPHNEIVSVVWTDESGVILSSDFSLDLTTTLPKTIYLEVTTLNGCISKAQIRVLVNNDLKVYFPNIFSPNGDGVNDRLVILKNKIPAAFHKLAIYDRLGNMVYVDNNPAFDTSDEGWDGTCRGQFVAPGVYIMIVELTDFTGKRQVLKQDLTVIR